MTQPNIDVRPIDALIPYARNSRTHSDSQVAQIAASLDLFGGSGSTLIACEKTGRHARLMELDPRYCDVIVRRWQDFTGQQARLGESDMTFADIEAAREGNEHGTTAVSTD